MSDDDTRAGAGSKFRDYFSGHAREYAFYRPKYPDALFDFLASAVPSRRQAWDCATGSGQAALALAERFERVLATDASSEQLAAAQPHERVVYRQESAESTSLPDASCDLVAVAQAVHWFDLDRFYAEARRVARPQGLVALWTYGLMRVDPVVDRIIDTLHNETVAQYWPDRRRLVDQHYEGLEFPFTEVAAPPFEMKSAWSAERALGYLRTWSAARRYAAARGVDPIDAVEAELRSAWKSGERASGERGSHERGVRWPLTVRVGRV